MKYILMMNGKKSDFEGYARWSKEDLQANIEFMSQFSKELRQSGELVSTEGLGWPSEAKLVRAGKDGAPITDGVFPGIQGVSRRLLDCRCRLSGASLCHRGESVGGAGTGRGAVEHAHRSAARSERPCRL